ncbi:MAG: heparinase II/III family protein [Fibrobacteria bacterium]|nr:heparinase II/III family protein [Fibrobacteria bacterium]
MKTAILFLALGLFVLRFAAFGAQIPYFAIDTTSNEFSRLKAFVDRAVGGSPGYDFSAVDAMLMYSASENSAYAELAITMVEEMVTAAEASIASGQRPSISGDSYLYVGRNIQALALTYDWAADRLSENQKQRWKAFADQAIYNIWNHEDAKWGETSHSWSGWSNNNPGNNYYYSFMTATMYWAVASDNQEWLNFLKTDRIPLLTNYFKDLSGGGSMEGTGYGTSHMHLFHLYHFWKNTTEEDLSDSSSHCLNSIDYWVHATVPTLERFAPIGDQSRVSGAILFDYHRTLMVNAVLLNEETEQAKRGMWWLNNISIDEVQQSYNLKENIYKLPETATKPQTLHYFSERMGDLFARTSWDTNATWVHFKAGYFYESHAHQDQGSFSIYNASWQAVTENIHTHSGIHQSTDVHNVIRFNNGGEVIPQRRSETDASEMIFYDSSNVLIARADLSKIYSRSEQVKSWTRNILFNRAKNTLSVKDTFDIESGITATWQLNTPVEPVVDGDSIIAGKLVIAPRDDNVEINISNWNQDPGDGWKIELTRPGSPSTFNVLLRVNAPTTWDGKIVHSKKQLLSEQHTELKVSPNPFYSSTTISFSIPVTAFNTSAIQESYLISLFNSNGQLIRKLLPDCTSGHCSTLWDGTDYNARRVIPGIYTSQVNASGSIINNRMIIIR